MRVLYTKKINCLGDADIGYSISNILPIKLAAAGECSQNRVIRHERMKEIVDILTSEGYTLSCFISFPKTLFLQWEIGPVRESAGEWIKIHEHEWKIKQAKDKGFSFTFIWQFW